MMTRRSARLLYGSLVGLLLGLGTIVTGLSSASAAPTGDVYVVQGIVGSSVSISVDATVVGASVAAKSVIGPLHLTPGQHVIELKNGASSLVSARFTVPAGGSLDVVAHRAADLAMTAAITVFRNDLSPVAPGKTRLVVSHVAVAPPADIRVDGTPLFRNVANGESLSLVVPSKSYSVDIVPTAGGQTILGPVRIEVMPGSLTRVFAIGSVADSSTDAIVQNLPVPVVGAGAPRSVHTGDGGQAADEIVGPNHRLWILTALGLALVGALGAPGGIRRLVSVTGSRHAR
jgi:Domain of unknown function (DUF4397)